MTQPTQSTTKSPDAPVSTPAVQRILETVETIVQQREEAARAAAPVKTKPRYAWNDLWTIERPPSAPTDTETLLNGLIDECGFLMREVAFRLVRDAPDRDEALAFMSRAMSLATTGAEVGLAVAKLRKASSSESRQRVTMERIERPGLENLSIRANE